MQHYWRGLTMSFWKILKADNLGPINRKNLIIKSWLNESGTYFTLFLYNAIVGPVYVQCRCGVSVAYVQCKFLIFLCETWAVQNIVKWNLSVHYYFLNKFLIWTVPFTKGFSAIQSLFCIHYYHIFQMLNKWHEFLITMKCYRILLDNIWNWNYKTKY